MNQLLEIGTRELTDKCINTCFDLTYLDVYDMYFRRIREEVKNVLEIGVAAGGSLRTWREYFPNAQIYGIDVNPDCMQREGKRIKITIASQDDSVAIKGLLGDTKLDIVIDDGSHLNQLTIASFKALYPYLNPNGFYCIEDIGLTWDLDIAQQARVGGWPGMRFNRSDIVQYNYRKDMVDFFEPIFKGIDEENGPIQYAHFWSKLCIMRKRP